MRTFSDPIEYLVLVNKFCPTRKPIERREIAEQWIKYEDENEGTSILLHELWYYDWLKGKKGCCMCERCKKRREERRDLNG
jgi:hypothetical protein